MTEVAVDLNGRNQSVELWDGVFTLVEKSTPSTAKPERKVYTCWVLDSSGRKSNTINLAIEYE